MSDLKYETETPYCSIVSVASRSELFTALDHMQVSWAELASYLGKINKATKNNLGVVMASCFGLYAIKAIKITEPSPFYFLIGSDEKVLAGEIDSVMKKFYRVLFQSCSLQIAMKEVDEKFKQFHVEKMFCIVFGNYISQQCIGKGRNSRIENLLSELVRNGMPRENLRSYRKQLKQLVKSNKADFDKYANLFMHGRYSITYEELYAFVARKV
ncbi:hypothetical protein AGMMS50256_32940 [Betaproteobacteria bacterium]|nr:hypothetical protein AGMMS50256_32940 [Betaproteobacteria bacterium]